jgi:proton glutamate symport protein
MKSSVAVLVALALALVVGAAIAASGSPALLHAADLVAPVGTLWVNAIRMTVIPLVVSLLITGIASNRNLSSIGRLGGRTLAIFVAQLVVTALIVMPAAVAVFAMLPASSVRPPLPEGAVAAAGQITAAETGNGFASWLTSLVPQNPIAAAATGAMLPLVVFTILLALAITRTPDTSRERLVGFFEALCDAMLQLVRWVVALAPVGVFALILPLAARGAAALAGGVGLYIAIYSIGCIVVVLLIYPAAAIGGGIPIRQFARAALPGQLIAFSTSSSIAALPGLVEGAERDLKMDSSVSGFVLPLAVSVFKPAAPVTWTVGSLFVAHFYGIPLHLPQLAIIGLASVFMVFISPGIPRGGFLVLAPLFLAIGLPVEGIGILIAVDAIPDIFATLLNATGDLLATVLVARAVRASPA